MAKSVVLTDTKIKHAKSREKEYNLAAGNGLYLRISPNGSKTWLFNYFKPFLGTRSNIGLGKYPALTLEKAKKKRDEYNALLAEDLDPKTVREAQSKQARVGLNDTFEKIFREWLEIKCSGQQNPDSGLDRFSAFAGDTPSLKVCGLVQL